MVRLILQRSVVNVAGECISSMMTGWISCNLFPFAPKPAILRGMEQKPRKSPALTTFIQMENRDAERGRKRLQRSMAKWPKYPHSRRAAAFCWLWDNYDGVLEVQSEHYLTWKGIARLAGLDGLKGRWGEPVTANALRRVFTRVDAEVQARRAAEQEAELEQAERDRRAQSVREWKDRVNRL